MSKIIMIVDDSSMMRLALRSALAEAGYTVIEAIHGLDALTKLKSGQQRINLIICDVNMPEMDGIAFVQTYRAIPELQYIPVLMLTTESGQDKKEAGKAAGVKAWMVKPFNKDSLMSAVGKLVCA
jgi:two-component system, chemotaxis family, chemotaxis protein CheY